MSKLLHASQGSHVSSGSEIAVFAFWMDDVCYAVPLNAILAVNPIPKDLTKLPMADRAVAGGVRYRGQTTTIVDFSGLLQVSSDSDAKLALVDELVAREKDHVQWIDALEISIREGTTFDKARDPHQCAFGRWYDNYTTRDKELRDTLDKFDEPHKRIHSLADKLLSLRDGGRVDQALEILETERNTTLREMRRLFRRVRQQLQTMARRVLLFLTEDGENPTLALVLDEIADVCRYEAHQLQQLDAMKDRDTGPVPGLFRGMLVDGSGPDCLLVETSRLIETFRGARVPAEAHEVAIEVE